jgi:hypothetical protein
MGVRFIKDINSSNKFRFLRGLNTSQKIKFLKAIISATPYTFPAGVLAFWKLDDLTDSSGNEYTLSNNNDVTFDTGKIGNAAVFSSEKFLAVNMQFNTYSSDWSFSVWIYQTNTPDNINTFPLSTNNSKSFRPS